MMWIIMFGKIIDVKKLGNKKLRVAKRLVINVKTVAKYWNMTEMKYNNYISDTSTK